MNLQFIQIDSASAESAKALLVLAQLDQDFFPQPWDKESWMKLSESKFLLGLHKDGEVAGFSLFDISFVDSFAHLLKILTVPSLRGLGLGKNLLNESIKQLKDRGIREFFLEVEEGNLAAIHVYEESGFKIIHRKKHFYSNGADALIMTLSL